MKARTLVSTLILVLAVLIIVGSCATGKKAIKAPIESVYGTWVNPDYNKSLRNAKRIIRPDGSITEYDTTETEKLSQKYLYSISESWMDSDGNKYYKVDLTFPETLYELWKLNDTNTVFESIGSQIDYPTELDPEKWEYRIHYRQE